ncbi:MAG: hypothetical protein CVV64_14645 [Candidatus Wallbacteria bacterium HGW-Wallbacteria-1]|jgi:selenocysteine lyase/cysteine desulfurase|uniref:Aminotransferase class V domain-containing protein n=1 Tax=Candidatus Wallbacteria bacterium HGW-Wallbacteria-1 TaxID=2013854 RepID=A0A2N1PM00_9BACT|nr:MAG: hypothetical protein CVV64_14645 [Candidatus Wallbacteria bacterium HGW-Wallbacteria-1]
MDDKEARTLFPVTEKYCYMDHAAVAPISSSAAETMASFARDMAEEGRLASKKWFERIDGLRKNAAILMGTQAANIAFIKNTTSGIIIASQAIPSRPGDNVIIGAGEFPANVYPWVYSRGLEVRVAPARDGEVHADDIEALMDNRTRAVSISMVNYANGCRANMEAIGSLCSRRSVFFVVDGIQALGCIKVHPADFHCDFLSADGHKWLLGPEGAGFLYVSDKALRECKPANSGWLGVTDPFDFENLSQELKSDASRFEEGTFNVAGLVALADSVDMILAAGPEKVFDKVAKLTARLRRGLLDAGAEILSPMDPHTLAGITTFRHHLVKLDLLAKGMQRRGIIVSRRGGGLRVSPHFYNTEAEIDMVLETFRSIVDMARKAGVKSAETPGLSVLSPEEFTKIVSFEKPASGTALEAKIPTAEIISSSAAEAEADKAIAENVTIENVTIEKAAIETSSESAATSDTEAITADKSDSHASDKAEETKN